MISPVLVQEMERLVEQYGLYAVVNAFRLAEERAWKKAAEEE